MVKTGSLVMKIAGRDSGRIGIVVEELGNGYFLVDGDTRRKKVNCRHLEFLEKDIKIGKNITSEEIRKLIADLGFKTHKHGQPKIVKKDEEKSIQSPKIKKKNE